MIKRINEIANIIIGGFIGAFIGYVLAKYVDYINNTSLYAMQSSPWYTGIQVIGIILIIPLAICIIIKTIIKKQLKK